jgi:hypothetical protein
MPARLFFFLNGLNDFFLFDIVSTSAMNPKSIVNRIDEIM